MLIIKVSKLQLEYGLARLEDMVNNTFTKEDYFKNQQFADMVVRQSSAIGEWEIGKRAINKAYNWDGFLKRKLDINQTT